MSSLDGTLFVFASNRQGLPLTAFRTGTQHKRCVVVWGGLGDAFFSLKSVTSLSTDLAQLTPGWSVVQPHFSSFYQAYSPANLDTDIEELELLLHYLGTSQQVTECVLYVFNTAVQDVVAYFARGARNLAMVSRVIFQFAVDAQPSDGALAEIANKMCDQGLGSSPLPVPSGTLPIAANRYVALSKDGTVLGGQDMFYHPVIELMRVANRGTLEDDAEVISTLQSKVQTFTSAIEVPILFVMCLVASYVPHPDTRLRVTDRLQMLCRSDITTKFLEYACDEHMGYLKGIERDVNASITTFLINEDRKRQERNEDARNSVIAAEKRKRSNLSAGKGGLSAIKRSPSQPSVAI